MRPLVVLGLMALVPINAFAVGGSIVKHGSQVLLKEGTKHSLKTVARETAEQAVKATATRAANSTARRAAATAAKHFGDDLVRQSTKLGSKLTSTQQRRMAILAKGMSPAGKKQMLTQASKAPHAGSFIDDLWKHRKPIAAGVGAVTVVAHGDDIANAAGQYIAKPLIESVISPVSMQLTSFMWWVIPIALGLGLVFYFQQALAIACARQVGKCFKRLVAAARG